MILLPIVERELRVAARRGGTYWARFQAALAALVPTGLMLVGSMSFASPAQAGAQMFQILSFLAFIYAMLAAVRLTADCLSAEKREGTLGFLFLTDLKPRDIVFGKLTATSCNALYSLLAIIPVLAVPVLLGGVTLMDVLRLALVLVNTLFFALSLAMLISALCWSEKKAVGMTVLLLFGFGAGLPLTGGIVASMNGPREIAPVLSMASPGFACALVPERAYGVAPGAFWFSSAVTHALGWLFLALTCHVLPRAWQDRPSEGRRRRWREWGQRLLMGHPLARADFRRRLLAVNPIYWLAGRERRVAWYPWILLGCVAAIGGWSCWALGVRGVEFWPLIFFTYFLNWFFKHWLANMACYAFSTDRDKGALELLLCTPLTVPEVLRGHRLALRRQFLAPVLVMLSVELVLYAAALQSDPLQARGEEWFLPAMFMAGLVVFVADVFGLVWTGWWLGATSKNASSAVSSTYFRVMVLPWMLVAVGMTLVYVAFDLTETGHAFSALSLWVVASLWADWFFGRSARRKLLTELRGTAVERYSGGDPAMLWWRRLGRRAVQWRTGRSAVPARGTQL